MKCLVVGCGYVGLPLGAELARQGHEVFGLRRSASAAHELKAAGIQPLAGDVTRPETLAKLPRQFDWVVNCVAAGGGAENYRQIYLEGNRNLVSWLADSPPQKFVYTSSTSVYGQDDGSLVTESSLAEPAGGNFQSFGRGGKSFAGHRRRLAGTLAPPKISRRDFARGRNLRAGTRPLVQAILARRGAHRRRRLAVFEHDSPRRRGRLHHRGPEKRTRRGRFTMPWTTSR